VAEILAALYQPRGREATAFQALMDEFLDRSGPARSWWPLRSSQNSMQEQLNRIRLSEFMIGLATGSIVLLVGPAALHDKADICLGFPLRPFCCWADRSSTGSSSWQRNSRYLH